MARPKKLSDFELLETAFEIISREGFDSFTLAQVAKAVRLSPAALIKRFHTKKRLAELARNQKWDLNLSKMTNHALAELSGLNGVFEFVRLIARSVDSKKLGEHLKLLGTEADDHRSKKKLAAYFATTREILARLLKEAIENGDLPRGMDPNDFAMTLEALIQGAIFQYAFAGGRGIEAHLQERVRSVLL